MKYITFLNSGCIDICKNMLISAENVGIDINDFYIACLDDNAYANMQKYKLAFLYKNQEITNYQNWSFDKNSNFRKIVKLKWKLIKEIYKENKNLCWVDTDIVFKKNPTEILKNSSKILFQCDHPGSTICSGFMVFNDTVDCENLINECGNDEEEDDQLLINEIALKRYSNSIAILNTELFPNGKIYYNYGIKKNAFIVHNNHMIGIDTKIQKFKDEELWFI